MLKKPKEVDGGLHRRLRELYVGTAVCSGTIPTPCTARPAARSSTFPTRARTEVPRFA
jgi:hypothetical protein